MLPIKRFSPRRRLQLLYGAAGSEFAVEGVEYPEWYLHRWHLLPEGYLSRRSIAGYEAVITRLYNSLREDQVHRLAISALRDPGDVLDIGCGSGRLLARVAERFPAARLTGIDLSPFMLERAVQRVPGARLVHGDSQALPWPDATFDAILAMHHLGHMPHDAAERVAAEAARVLRPGGRLVVADHRWHPLFDGGLEPRAERFTAGGHIRVRVLAKP
ncbi:MAG: class I SAM-dependent methyltransferase [Dehalococcoidia bacterium]|nr:class I SAM-dependent methyltransferase [Dehalococcoidia bacterium]